MSSPVEQIKARLGIVEVVSSYIKLDKAGANYKARCPFHSEKSASFFVSPARDTYHCFGCNRGGDILSFVQEIEGLDFLGALETLAARAGVELKPVDREARSEQERYYATLEDATKFYEGQLAAHPEATTYITDRGLTPETIQIFRLGFAPDGWRNLHEHLLGLGYAESDLEKVGLVIPGKSYDRFRSRIMFPLQDSVGRPVGFAGRIFGPETKEQGGKYINSPETPLYNKSRYLYGFDRAKVEIKKQDKAVLVEGQMDLLLSHQAGLVPTVAVSGTALTEEHLKFIKRLSNNVVMAFDGDLAGIAASRRAVDLALGLGMDIRIAELPEGKDPADIIAQDPSLWHAAIEQAVPVIDFYLRVLGRKGYDSRALKLAISKEVLPYVAVLPNAIEQAHFVQKIAGVLNLPEDPIWQEVKKYAKSQTASREGPSVLGAPRARRRDAIAERLVSIVLWQESLPEPVATRLTIGEELKQVLGDNEWVTIFETLSGDKERLILEAEIAYSDSAHLGEELRQLVTNLEEEVLKEKFQTVTAALRRAEELRDYDKVNEYLKECQELSQAINNLKQRS